MTTRHLHKHAQGVAHHLPHRTRLRIPASHRDAATIRSIHESLTELPEVHTVETNERTGSVLIHHMHNEDILPIIGKAIEGVAVDLFDALLEVEEESESLSVSIIGHVIRSTISRANARMIGYTGNSLDLKMLLPITFLGLGLLQAGRNERWWLQTPTYVLFYWAYDSYMKFHGPSAHNVAEHAGNGGGIHRISKGN